MLVQNKVLLPFTPLFWPSCFLPEIPPAHSIYRAVSYIAHGIIALDGWALLGSLLLPFPWLLLVVMIRLGMELSVLLCSLLGLYTLQQHWDLLHMAGLLGGHLTTRIIVLGTEFLSCACKTGAYPHLVVLRTYSRNCTPSDFGRAYVMLGIET